MPTIKNTRFATFTTTSGLLTVLTSITTPNAYDLVFYGGPSASFAAENGLSRASVTSTGVAAGGTSPAVPKKHDPEKN